MSIRLAREDRQASILQAGARAFARGGYAGTSMDDVAAETGVTRLILYRNFGSKEELYRAILEHVSGRLAEEFHRDLAERPTGEVGSTAMLVVAREDPAGFRLLWHHAAREPEFAGYAREQRELAVGAAARVLGVIADGTDGRWAARAVVAWLVEAVLAWLDEGDPVRDEAFRAMTTIGLQAMVRSWRECRVANAPTVHSRQAPPPS
jgi:AcrR family transcriptional regulator